MSPRKTVVVLSFFAATALIALISFAGEDERTPIEKADALFKDQNYKEALLAYEAILKEDPAGKDAQRIGHQCILCLHRLRNWDEAAARCAAFVKANPGTVWEARGANLLGLIFHFQPHYYYKTNTGEITRGRWIRGASYVNTIGDDFKEALRNLELAKTLYYALEDRDASAFKEFRAEVVNLNFDLARLLSDTFSNWQWQAFRAEETEVKTHYQGGRYSPEWPTRVKILGLYEEAGKYDDTADKAPTALAIYRKAAFFRAFGHQREEEEPIAAFRSLISRFPKDELAPEAQFMIARHLDAKKSFVEAKEEYRNLIKNYPASKWVSDSEFYIREMEKPVIALDASGVRLPGDENRIKMTTRNLGKVEFAAFPVKLDRIFTDPRNREKSWRDFFSQFLAMGGAQEHRDIQVAEWSFETGDDGRHQHIQSEVAVPLREADAYVIRAKGGTAVFEAVLVISDLAIIKKTDNSGLIVFVVDAVTGKPVPGADVHIKERYYANVGGRWGYEVNMWSGRTGEDGVYTSRITKGDSKSIQAFALSGKRCASTGMDHWYGYDAALRQPRIFTSTDRPVYRPGHTVKFRSVVRENREGEYVPAVETAFSCVITDPKGNKVFEKRLVTGEFGSLSDELVLDPKAPLGLYYISFYPFEKRHYQHHGGNAFRVEEYKKPEFKVTVEPGQPQTKAGSRIKVKIDARYYFGAPVADAEVSYRVTRDDYRHDFKPAGEWDWLYGRGYGYVPWWHWYYRWQPRPQELVLEGKGKTDSEGCLYVEIDTAEAASKLPDVDHLYSISAEVRDQSRRTIEGSGTVKATRSEYFAFLNPDRGFYQAGERATFKVVVQNAQGNPVKAAGAVEVYRLEPLPKDKAGKSDSSQPEKKYDEKLLLSDKFEIDASGTAFYKWVSDSVGRFAVVFRSKDSWGGEVVGRSEVWTVGAEFEGWRFRFADVEILTDKRSYAEGETANVMVSTDNAGAHILFSIEADCQILEYRVLGMEKKSAVIPIKIERRHVPNFFLRAASFHSGKPFAADCEVFVPPVDRFLNVSVSPDRAEYLPGQEADFRISVSDSKGNPVRTEVSLGVIDSSILYIQSEFRPDVRKYFYGEMRYIRSPLSNSQSIGFGGWFRDSAYYPEIKVHGMPLGWGGHAWATDGILGEERLRREAAPQSKADAGSAPAGAPTPTPTPSPTPSPTPTPAPSAPEREGLLGDLKGGETRGKEKKSLDSDKPEGTGELKQAEVRENFADTAFWGPSIVTGEDGKASVRFKFPDSLTTWKATAVAADRAASFGNTDVERVTRKNVMVRLQAPRFFIERDEVVLSAMVNNYLPSAKKAKVRWTFAGDCLKAGGEIETWAEVPASGEKRIDLTVTAVKEGKAEVTVEALTDEESDAMKLSFPVYVHGIQKDVTVSGVLRDKRKASVMLNIPKDRNPDATEFRLILSPSMASGLLEALPYLIEYPYGCVEQTASRFIPAVVVARTLKELNIDLETIAAKRSEINARHLSQSLARRWHRPHDPVFNTAELNRIVDDGLQRLYSFQRMDGSFGWWTHGPANVYMTAYVLYGLLEAQKAGYNVDKARVENAIAFLKSALKEDKSLANRCYVAFVLSHAPSGAAADELDLIYGKREELNCYMKTLLALALANAGDKERGALVLRNVSQLLKEDPENGTCRVENASDRWWFWYNDDIETNAFFLRGLLKLDPGSRLVPMLVKWLVTNRQGARWNSTKDTANCIFALMEYVKAEDELNPEYTITVDWPGVGKKEFNVTSSNVFHFDNLFLAGGSAVGDGEHKLDITVDGKGTLYFTAHLSYFTKEAGIKGAGHEVFVNRRYFRLKQTKRMEKRDGREIAVLDWEKTELKEGEILKSGERIEARLDIDAKNSYEYLVFEDPKPAGCEPVELRSGFSYGNLCSNMELRDEKVVFFVGYLEQGKHAILYQMRAETPGRFHALPAQGYAMYAPRVKGISDEWIMTITD